MTVLTVLAIIYEVLKLILFWEIAGFVLFFLYISPNQWKEIKEKRKQRKQRRNKKG